MKNFKKVLALVLAFAMVLSTMTVAFAANANEAEAKVLYDLDLFDGKSADEYMPALEDAATAPEALKLIGTALGWEIDPDATTTFEDVPAWAQPWVAYAVEMGITNGVSETEFGVDEIDGKRVVTWFLRALGYDMTEAWENTEELAAEAGLTIPATWTRDAIVGLIYEGLMATPVDGDATLIETIILGDAEKTAIAEKAGLVADAAKIVSAEATGTKTIEIKLNKAVDTDTTTVQVKKGAAIYSKSVEWNDAMNMATVTAVIDLPDADYTAIVTTADATLEYDFTVADEAAATVEITDLVLEDETADAEVAFVVNNQYGEDMEIGTDEVSVVAYNVTQGEAVEIENEDDDDDFFEIDTTDNADGDEEDAFEEGDIVRFTVTYLGMTTQANVTVIEAGASSVIVFGDLILEDGDSDTLDVTMTDDEDIQLEYTLLDQYGEQVFLSEADDADEIEDNDDVTFVFSDEDIIDDVYVVENDDDEGELFLRLSDTGDDGTVVITAVVNASGSVTNVSIVVNEDVEIDSIEISAPTEVVADGETVELEFVVYDQYGDTIDNDDDLVDEVVWSTSEDTAVSVSSDGMLEVYVEEGDDFEVYAGDDDDDEAYGSVSFDVEEEAYASDIDEVDLLTYFENGADTTIEADDITVYDQYGRDFDLDESGLEFTVEATTATVVTITEASDVFTITAIDEEEETITVTIENTFDVDGDDTVDSDDYVDIEIDIEVIASDDIDSYSLDEIGTLFGDEETVVDEDSSWAVEVVINGVYDGDDVYLVDDQADYVTSSSSTVVATTNTDGDLVVYGYEEGSSTISVWVDDEVADTETVAVEEDEPYAVSVELDDEDATEVDDGDDLTIVLVIEDQYGVDLVEDTSTYAIDPSVDGYWASEDTDIATVDGGVVTGVDDGVVTITYVTDNGVTFTFDVTVN